MISETEMIKYVVLNLVKKSLQDSSSKIAINIKLEITTILKYLIWILSVN